MKSFNLLDYELDALDDLTARMSCRKTLHYRRGDMISRNGYLFLILLTALASFVAIELQDHFNDVGKSVPMTAHRSLPSQ